MPETQLSKHDPYRNFNFVIRFGDRVVAGCRKMSGLSASVEAIRFRAGNDLSSVDRVMPGRVSYDAVTFEAGMTADRTFEDWANTLVRNDQTATSGAADPNFRRDVVVSVRDLDNNTEVLRYRLYRAWVSKFTSLSDLAGDGNEILFQTLEVQHEGYERIAE